MQLSPFAVAAVLAATVTAGLAAAPTPTPTPSPTAGSAAGSVSVSIAPAGLGQIGPNEDLAVDFTVSNDGDDYLTGLSATLVLDRTPVTRSDDLSSWLAASLGDAVPGAQLGAPVVLGDLSAGASEDGPRITVPAAEVGMSDASPFGARRLSIVLSAHGSTVAVGRSTIVWDAGQRPSSVPLVAAAPITVPVQRTGLIPSQDLANYTSPTGVLTRELAALADRPVALGIDPMIIASIRVLGTSAPASALEWLDRLREVSNETFPLAYSDADMAAVAQAGAQQFPGLTSFAYAIDPSTIPTPTSTPTESPTPAQPTPAPTASTAAGPAIPSVQDLLAWDWTRTDLAWPADDTVTGSELGAFAGYGWKTTILSDGNVQRDTNGMTLGAASSVGDSSVLVSSSLLSRLFREGANARSTGAFDGAMAQLAAALAVVGAERPAAPRMPLMTLDRVLPAAPFRAGDVLSTLAGLGWVQLQDVGSALASASTPATVVDKPEPTDRIAQVARMLTTTGAEDQFATVAPDPSTITGSRHARLLSLLSQSWVTDSAGWPTEVTAYLKESTTLLASVRVEPSSQINLGSRPELPVDIRNDLRVPVTVSLTVRSNRGHLIVTTPTMAVDLPAQSVTRKLVPVQTVGNGDVMVTESITTTGSPPVQLGGIESVTVNVAAGWEAVGTGVLIGLVVLLFAAGVVRSVFRGRRLREQERAADE